MFAYLILRIDDNIQNMMKVITFIIILVFIRSSNSLSSAPRTALPALPHRLSVCHCLRAVHEAGGRDSTLRQAVHHGCEAGPEKLRSICLAGEKGATDQKIPTDGRDGLPGPWHEGECDL